MKRLKQVAAFLLALCITVPAFGLLVHAAEGTLMFSDPQTKVGETFPVDLVAKTGGAPIGDVSVTMEYDASTLEFVSGEGVEEAGSGILSFFGAGTGSETEVRITMEFRALKTGDTTINVSESKAFLFSDEVLNLDHGSSAIKIAAADDGSTSVESTVTTKVDPIASGVVVNVNGTDYSFSEGFAPDVIPAGYSEVMLSFNGAERKFVCNETGIYLGFLVDSSGTGSFFLYNVEDATFAPFVELSISDTTSLIPVSEVDSVSLPEQYQKVELTVLNNQYPAWSDPAKDRFYLIYALNTRTGQTGLYQYDTQDGTYQIYEGQTETKANDSEGFALPGKIGLFLSENGTITTIGAGAAALLFFILMLVFGIKLIHRNQELDDLYDEYDIPDEEEEVPVKKNSRKQFAKRDLTFDDNEEDDFVEDFDSYDEPGKVDRQDYDLDNDFEFSEDDFEDEFEDDFDDSFDDGFDDDFDVEDVVLVKPPKKKAKQTKKMPGKRDLDDDDFDIDFIDL